MHADLTPVTGMTNGFIFQVINSLIESWGACLTCLDCKGLTEAQHYTVTQSMV